MFLYAKVLLFNFFLNTYYALSFIYVDVHLYVNVISMFCYVYSLYIYIVYHVYV